MNKNHLLEINKFAVVFFKGKERVIRKENLKSSDGENKIGLGWG